ncbi:MAG: proline racemase family protein, partial [Candidatus Limnocylindrales bacterium]
MQQPQQPVLRHYRGRNRRLAEEAYRLDAAHAARMAWMPVAHRWTDDWDGHTLSVVFESRAVVPASAAPMALMAPVGMGASAAPPPVSAPTHAHASAARAHARSTISTIDLHCAGEPLRLIRSGYPHVPEGPILERRRWVKEHADEIRRVTMFEPRGHRDMYGAVLLQPSHPDA